MRTSKNPVFDKVNNLSMDADERSREFEGGKVVIENATYTGVGLKILYYLFITLVSAFLGIFFFNANPSAFTLMLFGSVILGFVSAIIAMRSFRSSLVFGTLYCIGEGMVLGLISMIAETAFPGIVISVVAATLSVVVVCGVMFVTKLVRVTNRFYKFLTIALLGFLLSIIMILILGALKVIDSSNFFLNIGISFIAIIIASFVLIADMDRAYQLVENGGPKAAEWMVAFGIAYTVLWIYIEILRLAIIIMGRRR